MDDVTTTDTATAAVLDELRPWLDANWGPDLTVREWWRRLADARWSVPHWPQEWLGRGMRPADAVEVARAIRAAGALIGPTGFGTAMAGPTVLVHGTDDQKRRHLRPIVTGEVAYCQLFSEPGAGSDLAGLRTRAVRDGAEWVVEGQKVWTSSGEIADRGMLLARTDPDVPKHAGISYFLIDLHQPGVEVRPLREMTGRSFFNEVFLTGARVRDDDLVGGTGNGWRVANTTLAFERSLSGQHVAELASPALPGTVAGDLDRRAGDLLAEVGGPARSPWHGAAELIDLARRTGCTGDPLVRQALARLHTLERVNTLNAERARALQAGGDELPGLANLAKMGQSHAIRLARDVTFAILGVRATLHGYEPGDAAAVAAATGIADLPELVEAALFAQGPPIYGGSDQIQRNIVGERVLGLAREPGADRATPFRDLPPNG